MEMQTNPEIREVKHDVYGKRQRLPLTFYSFLVILK